MTFTIDARDVELFGGTFNGFFDEEGIEWSDSTIITDEDYVEAEEWSKKLRDKISKAKTLQQLRDSLSTNLPYYLEIKDNRIIFNWSCPNRVSGEYQFSFRIIFANIS